MKAAVQYELGGPDVLKYEEVPDPACGPHDIRIKVETVSIEGGDTLHRAGTPLAKTPHIVGYQAAGEIIEVGAEVQGYNTGQKVVTVNAAGSHAEQRVVPFLTAFPIPDGLSVDEAATIPIPFGTAHDCLFEFGRLQKGETVLVQAGASAVGLAAIQLAKRAGATVIATASDLKKLKAAQDLGLDHGINYVEQDLVAEVMKITDNKGVDLVVDPVGGPTLQKSIACLGHRGRVSSMGNAGREQTKFDLSTLAPGNRSVTGIFFGAEIATDRVQKLIRDLLADVAKGELKVVIDKTFKLSEAAEAHRYIESRKAIGRVLMKP
ncbi:quinone oxidoreductase family protein [Tepidicaulis sp. LMO-SS28]|uniref:quinone oxidoreductase family protein n=1 Tax=Tepidicaulis sp. LMO-SS28 TaxID=3447455 RepID=UPI003EE24B78